MTILVADIGGTNARFALSPAPGRITRARTTPTSAHESFAAALEDYLGAVGRPRLRAAAVAAAGPATPEGIRLTNLDWVVRPIEVARLCDVEDVAMMNDLEAVAAALPRLKPGDTAALGPARHAPKRAVRLAVNIGTGFGAGAAIPLHEESWFPVATEAGHMAFAAASEEETALLGTAATVEDLLSGAGVARAHAALTGTGEARSAADILSRTRTDPQAKHTATLLARLAGRVTGDLVLAHAAWGGVGLTGSVAEALIAAAGHRPFLEGFAAKGPMTERMRAVPVARITRADPALYGLSHCF